ncbi:DUF2723 domain-containing protein [bacterium]|nr:DUF2723 domain-containing protein [bacterium]
MTNLNCTTRDFLFFFLLSLILVINTSLDVGWEDSGELTSSIFFLSLSHPTGFPFYLHAARLVQLLPLGSIAFRANLFSTLSGIASLLWLYFLVLSQTNRRCCAILAVLILLTTPHFLLQSANAEIYTFQLSTLGFVLILSILSRQALLKRSRLGWQLLILLCWGLSSGLQPHFFLLMSPIVIYALIMNAGGNWRNTQNLLLPTVSLGLITVIIGSSISIYIPIRGTAGFIFHWGPVLTVRDMWDYITALPYRTGFSEIQSIPSLLLISARMKLLLVTLRGSSLTILWPLAILAYFHNVETRGFHLLIFCILSFDIIITIFLNPMGIKNLQTSLVSLFCISYYVALGTSVILRRIRHSCRL